MLEISEVRFFGEPNGNFITYVSAVLGGCILLRDMRLVRSQREPGKVILAMPARKTNDGRRVEFYYPIRRGMRGALEKAVFTEWERTKK